MTNDEELDRLEQELRDYLRTPRKSWKRDPRWRWLLEHDKQRQEELKKNAPANSPDIETE
jgi:hypothetical protein